MTDRLHHQSVSMTDRLHHQSVSMTDRLHHYVSVLIANAKLLYNEKRWHMGENEHVMSFDSQRQSYPFWIDTNLEPFIVWAFPN